MHALRIAYDLPRAANHLGSCNEEAALMERADCNTTSGFTVLNEDHFRV
jgi:hypothetical protein